MLYNRHGSDDRAQHLQFLVGSITIGVAAVAIEPAAHGDPAVFAGALAVSRLVLAAAHGDGGTDILRARIARACLASALLFAVSIVVPEPFTYLLWLAAIGNESGAMLREDREAAHRARREHSFEAFAPTDPSEALDPHHFAERFGLFLIILLGEVLVEAGQAPVEDTAGWIAVGAALSTNLDQPKGPGPFRFL